MRSTPIAALAVLWLLSCVTGPAAAEDAAPSAPAAAPARPATVLLVTDASLTGAWQPFAVWKTAQGKAVRIVTVQAIAKGYEGADIQAKIRACVLEHVAQRGTRWVVLGGDSEPGGRGLVPDRDTPHVVMGRKRYADIPTDLYYLSAGDWDANGDGVYGEWEKDKDAIDWTHPRASLGRIPVRTAADVQAYTDKVIGYESRYPAKTFAGRIVYTCPEKHAYPKLGTSGTALGTTWAQGEVLQYFADKTPWDKDAAGDHDLTPGNLTKLINAKRVGKFHIHGHGFLPVWVLEGRTTLNKSHVEQLVNEDAYPIITTVSCFTGQYDAGKDPSITESMLRRPKGGAIAIIAPSREGVPVFAKPSDFRLMMTEGKMDGTTETMTRFWSHGLAKSLTLGEAFRLAKADMADAAGKHPGYHWVQCELNLLGDPTLDMRARDPVTPTLVAPASVALGARTLSVDAGAPGATVCFWKGDEVYEVVVAGEDGKAVATVTPETPGALIVTVSGPSLNVVSTAVDVR